MEQFPSYLFKLKFKQNTRYATRNSKDIRQYKNSFFPSTIKKWNMLDSHVRSSESIIVFKRNALQFIQPKVNIFLTAITLKE